MANTKSAKKRIIINQRNGLENKHYKTLHRNLLKEFLEGVSSLGKKRFKYFSRQKLDQCLGSIFTVLDKGRKKNVFHKKTAQRKKLRFAFLLEKLI